MQLDLLDKVSLTMSAITFIGIIFMVYNNFHKPQEKLEKDQALDEQRLESKANILAQQVQWEKEANEKKFSEMGVNLKEVMTLTQNHIHTLDTKIDALKVIIEQMGREIVKLNTIINERIPKKDS